MNFRNIINEIEKTDPGAYEQLSDRRSLLKGLGAKVAVAALPLTVGALFPKKANAQATSGNVVINALNFALEISYFQYNFFRTANNTGALINTNPGNNTLGVNDLPGFQQIETNELAHINFLNTAITSLGGTPYTPQFFNPANLEPFYVPTAYDFTMGGTYNVFSNYATFLIVAQTFQDTYVRGLNGYVPQITTNTTVLTQLLQILSVEGRHAGHIRTVRRYTGAPEVPAPWITNDIAPIIPFQPNYAGEANLVQVDKIVINTLPDKFDVSGVVPKISATAAFDEPLDATTVLAFFKQFIKP